MILLRIPVDNDQLQVIYTNLLDHFESINPTRPGLTVTKVENNHN